MGKCSVAVLLWAPAPVGGGSAVSAKGRRARWRPAKNVGLFRCVRCHFVVGEPREELSAGERYETDYHAFAPAAPVMRYQQWLERAEGLVGRGHVLEIGAGSGGFVQAALARGWKVDANEVSDSGLEMLRRTAAAVEQLREMWRVTRPGGLLILTTPNFDGLSRRWLGVRWRVVDPEHLGYFTRGTLSRVLREVGYTFVDVRSRSLDVLSWRRARGGSSGVARFDPHASARLREAVQGSRILRFGKALGNGVIGASGLGDSLIAWARK